MIKKKTDKPKNTTENIMSAILFDSSTSLATKANEKNTPKEKPKLYMVIESDFSIPNLYVKGYSIAPTHIINPNPLNSWL